MASQQEFLEIHHKYPEWNASKIAARLGCNSAYVRATSSRLGITLPGALTTKVAPVPRPRKPKVHREPRPDGLVALGRACRAAGLTLADIRDIAETVNS